MEAKVFRVLFDCLAKLDHRGRAPRHQFDDRWIIMVYLWAVINDRPVCWSCDPQNWPPTLLAFPLPSNATMSRRLRSVGVLQLFERWLDQLSDSPNPPLLKTIDSKPMTVGAYSKDRDAKSGRLADGLFARGYRLHAICYGRFVRFWTIASMNVNDSVIGPKLLKRLEGGGYAVGDNAYDTNLCHQHASNRNHQMVAPPRFTNRHVRDARYNCRERLRTLDLLASPLERCGMPNQFGIAIYNARTSIESSFSELSKHGLNYLPAWVRGPRRVALFTAAKLTLHAQRCRQRQQ